MENKILTVFLILLTLSIGLVSINLPLSSANTQNNALSQSGDKDDGEQGIRQSQSSEQNGQVVSGESTIASGNNILCEDQDNSDELPVLNDVCNLDETNPPTPLPPSDSEAVLVLTSIQRASGCIVWFNPCPNPDGRIIVTDLNSGQILSF